MPYDTSPWRQRLHTVIFEADTRAGRAFDVALILCIITSIALVVLESVAWIGARWGRELFIAEMAFTIVFTIEYILRLVAVRRPLVYARSMFGIIDLLAVAPTWLALIIPGAQLFLTVRVLRVLRVFRVLKLSEYLIEAGVITAALRASRRKIFVFLFAVATIVVIIGSLIYVVEGPENGYNDIPLSMYWTIVTLTTVGYGDISPQTPLGRLLSAMVMIVGYAIIAVPTGIVTTELSLAQRHRERNAPTCDRCGARGVEADDSFCRKCGESL